MTALSSLSSGLRLGALAVVLLVAGAVLGGLGEGWRVAGWLASGVAGLAAIGTLLVLRRVRADLAALAETAEHVSRNGDFAMRFKPTATGGEVAALRAALNHCST
jgi:hypothetical protein